MLIKLKKAQATAEYAILFAIVISAAMGVQTYVKRALQARMYDAANDFVNNTNGTTFQWEGVSGSKTTTDQYSNRYFTEDFNNTTMPYTYNETMGSNYTSSTTK
ncbi:MAG: hypothetical protein PHU64_02250 [Candidatus Omnitrophica bacterium]|nr:hypothetical protein [Candidatus Omnitrophota bacterium]MDD5429897.1 hypothetical protein [Candidatus Omnitrophota bacterium]